MAHLRAETVIPPFPRGETALKAAGYSLLLVTLTLGLMVPGGPFVLRDYSYLEGWLAQTFTPGLIALTILAAGTGLALIRVRKAGVWTAQIVGLGYLGLLALHMNQTWSEADSALFRTVSVLESFDGLPALVVMALALRGRFTL